jgi:hypothetical protein
MQPSIQLIMKKTAHILPVTFAATLMACAAASAQIREVHEEFTSGSPDEGAPKRIVTIRDNATDSRAELPRIHAYQLSQNTRNQDELKEAQKELRIAQEQLKHVREDMTLLDQRAGNEVRINEVLKFNTLDASHRGMPGRVLVVPGGNADAKMLLESEEDLNVMAHLLEKAMNLGKDEGRLKAAGIDLLFSHSQSLGVRHLYLEGYGALFLFKSPIPIKPEAAAAQGDPSETQSTSAWDEARRELFQAQDGRRGRPFRTRVDVKAFKENYDEAQVASLKSSVVEALREAANMRHVKPDEHVTVVLVRQVSEGGPKAFARYVQQDAAPFGLISEDVRPAPSQEGTLILRVLKRDAEALAQGTMSAETFTAKASVILY